MFRGFFNDPFFESPNGSHSSLFNEGQNMGMRGRPQLPQPDHRRSNQMSVARPFNDLSMSPFGGMDSFSSFNNIFSDMHNLMSRSVSSTFMDPSNMMDMNKDNAFGYSSMKVQSYVDDGSGKPKTYEAHKSTKYAPGGVRQVQKGVKDSEAGVEKMSVGRHLKDRGHVITKSRDKRSGAIEESQDFQGFVEEEQPIFNQEWDQMTRRFMQQESNSLPHSQKKRNKLREQCLKPKMLPLDHA